MEKSIFEETGFIAIFLVASAFVYLTLGDKVLYHLLWLLLAGQIVLNWQVLEKYIKED